MSDFEMDLNLDMDYYIDPVVQYPRQITTQPGLNPVMPILREVPNPNGTEIPNLKDCILMSVDTELDPDTGRITQLGWASVDTREVHRAESEESAKSLLTSHMVLFQKPTRRIRDYLYGTPARQYGEPLKNILPPIFTIVDPDTGKPRNIILVGLGIQNDIATTRASSGIDILSIPTIASIVDISQLISRVYITSKRYHGLKETLKLLGMYRKNLHTAGNDAMYTLKALLLMYQHGQRDRLSWKFDEPADQVLVHERYLDAITRIGRCNNGTGRVEKRRFRKKLCNQIR